MNLTINIRWLGGGLVLVLVLVAVVIVLMSGEEEPQAPIFEATVADNVGAVSYNVFIPETGPSYVLQLWPMADGSRSTRAPLDILVKLAPAGGEALVDERARVATGSVRPWGFEAPVDGWLTWSRTFTPSVSGLHEIVLAVPQGAPKVLVRVGAPEILK